MFSTLMFGTVEGILVALIVSVVQGLTVSAGSGPIGILMQFLSLTWFVLATGLIYRLKQTSAGAVIALAIGMVVTTILMIGQNLILTPIFLTTITEMPLNVARRVVVELLPYIIGFNAIKSIINAVVTFVIFKTLKDKIKNIS